jgi:hypothetical protein
MRGRLIILLVVVPLLLSAVGLAQRHVASGPDLQGIWDAGTLTPLQRPAGFIDRATFTREEAAEYDRTFYDRTRNSLPSPEDRLLQSDFDDMYVERKTLDGLRTSLIVEPSTGMLPPLLPPAQARAAGRPKRSFDDPETLTLVERCLINMTPTGSAASPPILPAPLFSSLYQIVQTNDAVVIFTEWIHDARIIRMNRPHLAPGIRRWLGDSIGHWEGNTLVVDTTNFRPDTHNLGSAEALHVVERLTRIDATTLRYRVTVDDPETWATPWVAEWPFRAASAPMYEVACHEGNYTTENFLRGARADERRTPDGPSR